MEFSHPYRVYLAIKNFELKLSRKVKACSQAENKPVDIFLKLKLMSSEKTMSKFSSGGSGLRIFMSDFIENVSSETRYR